MSVTSSMGNTISEDSIMVTHARVVFVNSRNHLTDTTGHDCRYRTADGNALLPGYWYLVSWSEDIEEPLFDAQAHYAGPFDSEGAARNAIAGRPNQSLFATSPPAGASDPPPLGDAQYFPDWHCGR